MHDNYRKQNMLQLDLQRYTKQFNIHCHKAMDNSTEDTTPDYCYVVDSTIETNKNPSYVLRIKRDIQQSKKNKTKRNDFKRTLGKTIDIRDIRTQDWKPRTLPIEC